MSNTTDWAELRAEWQALGFDGPESVAARKILEALDGRSAAERARVLRWAGRRFITNGQRRPGDLPEDASA